MGELTSILKELKPIPFTQRSKFEDDNGTKFYSIFPGDFNRLETFGLLGIFNDHDNDHDYDQTVIITIMYEKIYDFQTPTEAKITFDSLFKTPEIYYHALYDEMKERHEWGSEFILTKTVPVTYQN